MSLKYLLDTNICIHLIAKRSPSILRRLYACAPGEVGVSAITVAELRFGADKSNFVQRNHAALDQFLLPLEILPFEDSAARVYGLIRSHLERKGTPIGPMDTLIGAHGLSVGVTIVTNNTREFKRIPGLKIQDWTK